MHEQEQEPKLQAQPPEQAADVPAEGAAAARAADLDRVAAELADQRAELIEQWERLARVEEDWQQRRDEAVSTLQALAERLAAQDEALTRRASDVEAAENRLQHWQEQLEQLR